MIKKLLMIGLISLNISGCETVKTNSSVLTSNNVQRLIDIPDAETAKKAAPNFTKSVLNTIIDLEAELKHARSKE